VNLPDPVKLGLTIRYFNHDDVGLYFQITGSGTGYTFGTVNLGLLASGADAYQNLDEFASRAKPSASDLPDGEMEENITLILKAYTDSGYTNLKWTYERIVTVHWINSADPAWTVEVLNNFDDGTPQGWNITTGSIGVATDYVLSAPYSLKGDRNDGVSATGYAPYLNYFRISKDSDVLVHIGYWDTFPAEGTGGHIFDSTTDFCPRNKWMRVVVPLPANQTLTLKIFLHGRRRISGYVYFNYQNAEIYKAVSTPNKSKVFAVFDVRFSCALVDPYRHYYIWLDDFKILSK
jgi:hypothetical protein